MAKIENPRSYIGKIYLHVVPENDRKRHCLSIECECSPLHTEDNLVIHHAWDTREKYERMEKILDYNGVIALARSNNRHWRICEVLNDKEGKGVLI